MIIRFVIKTVTTLTIGGMLVGWASLGGSPAARTLRAEAGSFSGCAPCKRFTGAGPGGVAQPVQHKVKPVVTKTKPKHEPALHAAAQRGGAL